MLDAGIRETLGSRPDKPIDYFADTWRRIASEQRGVDSPRRLHQPEVSGQAHRCGDRDPSQSLRFALDHRAELFADAPIVFVGLDAPDERVRRAGPGIAGLTVGIAHAKR